MEVSDLPAFCFYSGFFQISSPTDDSYSPVNIQMVFINPPEIKFVIKIHLDLSNFIEFLVKLNKYHTFEADKFLMCIINIHQINLWTFFSSY